MLSRVPLPPIWLIVFIVGLPQLSETVYTPALPELAKCFGVSHSSAEYTLTIYLFSFAIGTLFWGWISDLFGRKVCVLYGIIVFIIGSLECYFAQSFTFLMLGRFIQGFGGSIGSVLGQAISRDAFHGSDLSKAYAVVAASLAIFPAIGPVLGGIIVEIVYWNATFIFLSLSALVLFILTVFFLPETHRVENRQKVDFQKLFLSLLRNSKVMSFALIVGVCNGILFSYFAEGPFFLEKLGLTPRQYGMTFLLLANASCLGGICSKKAQQKYRSSHVMYCGIICICIANLILSLYALVYSYFPIQNVFIIITILMQMLNMFGIALTVSNALSMALVDFKWCVGTASSIFGFIYYCLISFFTLLMGVVHNGTLMVMPFYFLTISVMMLVVYRKGIMR
jgi:Bcr/CflA subfamily drug resistance transporter